MKTIVKIGIIFGVFIPLLTLSCTPENTSQTPTIQPSYQSITEFMDAFPLKKGAYWIYEGSVMWQQGDEAEVMDEHLTWKMEVVDTIQREQVKGYLIKGHPRDLAWYEPDKERGTYVVVQVGSKYYESREKTWERLKDENDLLIDLVDEGQIFLDLPLWSGKFFGETAQLTRPGISYRWFVSEEQSVYLTDIKGVPSLEQRLQYTLAFRTLPDHIIIEFVPGIGITHYEYGHHGTVSNVNVRLVEYYPGH
jgi:hypothetical protein